MTSFDEFYETLIDNVKDHLYNLKQKELQEILTMLISGMKIRELVKLITDENHFSFENVFKLLERKRPEILKRLLEEPSDEKDMKVPITNLFKDMGYKIAYEVPYPLTRRKRKIDLVAYKPPRRFLGGGRIVSVEIKSKASLGDIDKSFSQAVDYLKCSD